MPRRISSFADVVKQWPSLAELAHDIGAEGKNVWKWRERDSIPDAYWLAIVNAAEKRGFEGVTLEAMAKIADRQRKAAA